MSGACYACGGADRPPLPAPPKYPPNSLYLRVISPDAVF